MRHAVAVNRDVSPLTPRKMKLLIKIKIKKMIRKTKHLNKKSLSKIMIKKTPQVTKLYQNLRILLLINQRHHIKISRMTLRNQTVKYQTMMTILMSQIQKEMTMRIASGRLATVRNPGVSLLTLAKRRQYHLMPIRTLIKTLKIIKVMMLMRTLIRNRPRNS